MKSLHGSGVIGLSIRNAGERKRKRPRNRSACVMDTKIYWYRTSKQNKSNEKTSDRLISHAANKTGNDTYIIVYSFASHLKEK